MINRTFVVAAAILVGGCSFSHGPAGPTVREHKTVALDKSELTRVRVEMGGGELEMKGGAANLLDADFTYNVPDWKPTVEHTTSGTQADLKIVQRSSTVVIGSTENRWQLALNDTAPIEVVTHMAAGEAQLKLGSLNLRKVEVQVGAGEANVDLRGNPTHSYRVDIEGGVGQATVHVPAHVAISATASGGIGEIKVDGLEKRDGRWINPRATSSPVTIELNVHGGIGEIRIVAGLVSARPGFRAFALARSFPSASR